MGVGVGERKGLPGMLSIEYSQVGGYECFRCFDPLIDLHTQP